jgi:hypothetical protein
MLRQSSKQMMFSGKAHGGAARLDAEFMVKRFDSGYRKQI